MKKEGLKQTLHNTDHNEFKDFSVSKQEALQEFAKVEAKFFFDNGGSFKDLIILGAKWQQGANEKEIQILKEELEYEKRKRL